MRPLDQSDLQGPGPAENWPSTSGAHLGPSMQAQPPFADLKWPSLFFPVPIRFFQAQDRICFAGLKSNVWKRSTFGRRRWPDEDPRRARATLADESRTPLWSPRRAERWIARKV